MWLFSNSTLSASSRSLRYASLRRCETVPISSLEQIRCIKLFFDLFSIVTFVFMLVELVVFVDFVELVVFVDFVELVVFVDFVELVVFVDFGVSVESESSNSLDDT